MNRPPGPLTLSEDDRRTLAPWAADCAEHVLSLFERHAPDDDRPRKAIDGLRAFARGELKVGPIRALSVGAHAAARAVADPAAIAAARAAGQAAATAHMAAHARGTPAYAAKAVRLGASDDPDAAADSELRWAASKADLSVRAALSRLPTPHAGGGELGANIRKVVALLEG
jgi:hypothetical protein